MRRNAGSLFFSILLLLLMGCQTSSPVRVGSIQTVDPRMDLLVPGNAHMEIIGDGFEWTEGPVWVPSQNQLLFSDIPTNTIYRWKEGEGISVYLRPAGYSGPDPAGKELGTNGLLLDYEGRLILCDHGNRQIARLIESNYTKEVLADRYRGKRLNSPNDAVLKSNGDLYFTDPPYGLEGLNNSPQKELPFNGVYRLSSDGELTLLTDELTFPNGIAFSPDESTLYVANSDPEKAIWMAYDVLEDGSIGEGRIFFDATPWSKQGKRGLPDGMAVDQNGNLWATGPGGVIVFSPDGTHLGTLETGQATANCTFGGDDGSTLFITADMLLLKIKTDTKGLVKNTR